MDRIEFRPQLTAEIRMSEVVSALSYALDITEGQPEGHSVRSCMIGMRLAREMRMKPAQQSALFYALVLKDLGCSSNASKICYLFGSDDHKTKSDAKTTNWTSLPSQLSYIVRNTGPGLPIMERLKTFFRLARNANKFAREIVEIRCDRGAQIARQLQMPEETALAIRSLDEHWDGGGHPQGLRGEQIPLLARILGLAQTVEVFYAKSGLPAALEVAKERRKKWFDPELVKILHGIRNDHAFWESLNAPEPFKRLAALEPVDRRLVADGDQLDRIAVGFGQVIDAKSPWTYRHSEGVAAVAGGIAGVMGFKPMELRLLRRAALLHDIGKLGISNLILDKPGRLTPEELEQMRKHPFYTRQILDRVRGFSDIADVAAAHHERLDGKGYHQGIPAAQLGTAVRILTVADMYEALAAKRPYRDDLSAEQVMEILNKQLGSGLDPTCVEALKVFLDQSHFEPVKIAA